MMRIVWLVGLLMVASVGPGFAQSAPAASPAPEKPVDKGPDTPAANGAYQGGGVILQGAPGAPAPTPQATPAGQTPSTMVAPK